MHAFTRWILTLFTSPLGVFVLAALDSTLFFSLPFGIDAVVVLLSARLHSLAWIVPLLAASGSVLGAALTFWMGRKIGEKGLDRFLNEKRLEHVQQKIKRSGAVALAILDLVPPPFPFTAFVLAAGALDVKTMTFFVTLVVVRMVRFGAEAALAVRYGRSILTWMESDLFHDIVFFFIVVAIVFSAVSLIKLYRSTRAPHGPKSGPRGPHLKTSGRRSARRAPA